jgi:hypothetical protein
MSATLPVPHTKVTETEESLEAMIDSIAAEVEVKLKSLTPDARKRWTDDLRLAVKFQEVVHSI